MFRSLSQLRPFAVFTQAPGAPGGLMAPFSSVGVEVLVDGVQPPMFVPNKRPGKASDIPPQSLFDAIATVRSMYAQKNATSSSRIQQGFDLGIRLGIDPKRGDHNVRGVVVLPHGTGRNVFVTVITSGVREAEEARAAGADLVGGDELIQRIAEEPEATVAPFKACVATPDMLSRLARVAKVLGPRGLMPNPKAGTLTPDVAKAVRELKKGRVEYRTDRAAWVKRCVGKGAYSEDQMRENVLAFAAAVAAAKPEVFQAPLSRYFADAFIKTTSGPRIFIKPDSLLDELRKAKLVTN